MARGVRFVVPDCADLGAEGRDVRWVSEEVIQDMRDGNGVEVDCREEHLELESGLMLYRRGVSCFAPSSMFNVMKSLGGMYLVSAAILHWRSLMIGMIRRRARSCQCWILRLRNGVGVVGPDFLEEGAPSHFPAAFG